MSNLSENLLYSKNFTAAGRIMCALKVMGCPSDNLTVRCVMAVFAKGRESLRRIREQYFYCDYLVEGLGAREILSLVRARDPSLCKVTVDQVQCVMSKLYRDGVVNAVVKCGHLSTPANNRYITTEFCLDGIYQDTEYAIEEELFEKVFLGKGDWAHALLTWAQPGRRQSQLRWRSVLSLNTMGAMGSVYEPLAEIDYPITPDDQLI